MCVLDVRLFSNLLIISEYASRYDSLPRANFQKPSMPSIDNAKATAINDFILTPLEAYFIGVTCFSRNNIKYTLIVLEIIGIRFGD